MAHASMLGRCGVLSPEEADLIVEGLAGIGADLDDGRIRLSSDEEDVHLAVERILIERIGPVGGMLHTARSRNDQVALDLRLYILGTIDDMTAAIRDLQRAFVRQAELHRETMMPGYTHMQRAQPILLAHHLLAYVSMLDRDAGRMLDCRRRADRSPLGAAALAGTSFPIDRFSTALDLGLSDIDENSIDAVSDRDALLEFLSAASITMMHLSRVAEELVLWSTREFRYITISDAYTTGSSIMPQKKNPDMAELVRGKTGRVYGALMSLLTMMKGLPLSYNRDMQEDKPPLFDAADTLMNSLLVMTGMIEATTYHTDRMEAAAAGEYSTATELADYLVRKGIPFRDAHHVVGRIVAECVRRGCELHDLSPSDLQEFSPLFLPDAVHVLDPRASINAKRSSGSTGGEEVLVQIRRWKERLGIY